MSDLISREDAIKAVTIAALDDRDELEALKALPSADAVSMEEHIKELNDLAVEWKAKFAKAETITDEIYDETMAKVAKECEKCKERLRNIRPSAEAVTHGRLIDADALSEKLCETTIFIKDGEVFQRMINDAPTVPVVDITQRDLCQDISCADCPFMQETCKLMDYIAYADRPHGEWICKGDYAECSECGGSSGTQFDGVEPIPRITAFCPHCGADMRKENK